MRGGEAAGGGQRSQCKVCGLHVDDEGRKRRGSGKDSRGREEPREDIARDALVREERDRDGG